MLGQARSRFTTNLTVQGRFQSVKIAIVNSFYREELPSGENRAVRLQLEALQKAGHDAQIFSKQTDLERRTPLYPMRVAATVAFGVGGSLLKEIQDFEPDIVHVHNLFPNIGWSWLSSLEVPIVATLHNYRTFCSAGTAMLDGHPCSLCQESGSHQAVLNRCYRQSAVATIPLSIQTRKPFLEHPVIASASGLVILSPRMREVFKPLGIEEKNHQIIPNFVPSNPLTSSNKNGRWLWVGRISAEKGLKNLLSIWPQGSALDIFGDGPQRALLEDSKPDGGTFHGMASPEDLRRILPNYTGIVISSEWPETAVNLVHLEAIASGLPVIARAGSTSADEVATTGHGSTYSSKEELHQALAKWNTQPADPSRIMERFNQEYSEQAWMKRMVGFYQSHITQS